MTSPRIVVRYFNEGAGNAWTRLVRVLEHSVREHCPDWTLDLEEIPAAANMYSPMGRQGDVANTRKLDAWADAVTAAADGDRLLLLDADTLIRRRLDDVWSQPFDLAYTVKVKDSRYPFNGGVVFLRVSPANRAFILKWRDVTRWFLEHPNDHQVWLPPFGGINQSALGMLFTSPDHAWPAHFRGYRHGLDVRRLPCLEWNCEDEHWDAFDPGVTRVIHFKSHLQRATLNGHEVGRQFAPLVSEWRAQERAMKDEQQPRAIPRAPQNNMVTPGELECPEDGALITVPENAGLPRPGTLTRKQRRKQRQKGQEHGSSA